MTPARKRGRPPAAPGTRRDEIVPVRLTPAERAAMASAAASEDPPADLSEWLRDRALEALDPDARQPLERADVPGWVQGIPLPGDK